MKTSRKHSKHPQKALDKAIKFTVEHLDPLGQGVDKSSDKITFISKTLPDESGDARLRRAKKGVQFAQLESIAQAAANRIEPSCTHYTNCPGCHYLHTDYQSELSYKKAALQRALQKVDFDPNALSVVAADSRSYYRNRIQLHYRDEKIGLIDSLNDTIVDIPNCQVVHQELQQVLKDLYSNTSWISEHKGNGHCELYVKDGEVNVVWDQAYAHGGFTQVNEAMNRQLIDHVDHLLTKSKPKSVLDLFCGNGNLSNTYIEQSGAMRVMIDNNATLRHSDFVQLDLLKANAFSKFRREHQRHSFDAVVLDPPRAGFKGLSEWVATFTPKHILYVSCSPATLARDLASITNSYDISGISLLDMFPGTHHFETVVALSRS